MKNFLLLIGVAVFLVGCGGKPPATMISGNGIVTDADGQPMEGIMVNFQPDLRMKNSGPSSTAISDEKGEFSLRATDGSQSGVVPGAHRVTLFDTLEERVAQGEEAKPSRIPAKFQTEIGALEVDVKEGQKIELKLLEQ